MKRESIRSPLCALLSGLMLTACGGAPEEGLVPPEEGLGSQESAICSGSSVSTLTILGASSYGGEVAGGGSWAVTYPANAVHLDFYVDGILRGSSELQGDANRSGNWNFSYSPVGCGSHTLEVRAYPMTISSLSTDRCPTSGTQVKSSTFTQTCPSTPSLSCSRSGSYVNCTGSGAGTPFWQERIQYAGTNTTVAQGWSQGTWSRSFYCPPTSGFRSMSLSSSSSVSQMIIYPDDQLTVELKVRDSTGMDSPIRASSRYACGS